MATRSPLISPPGEEGVERQWILAAAGILFLLIFLVLAGNSWGMALYRLLTDGVMAVVWLGACTGLGVWLLRPFQQTGLTIAAALGIGAYSLLTLGLGLAGGLNRITADGMIVVGLALGALALRRGGFTRTTIGEAIHKRVPASNWLWLLIIPFFAIATVAAFTPPGILWGADEPNGYDVVEYHLQIPREWYELGRIIPLRHNVFSFFPFNVETHYLLAMHLRGGPWEGMYLAQLMHLAMVALSVAAIHSFVGRKGLLGVLLAAATPWLTMLGSIAYNEGGTLLFGTLAIGWTLRAIDEGKRTLPMALAGVFAGLACGVKLTAVPMLLVLVPVAFAIAMAMRRQLTAAIRPIGAFIVCAMVVFSPWLLRNLAWARNPIFPEGMSILGHAHFSPEQVTRWQQAYIPPPGERDAAHRLSAMSQQIFADWRFGYALFPAAGIAIFGAIRRRGGFSPPLVCLLFLLIAWLVFWIGFTHLQGRFFVLAIPVAAMIIARIDQPIARLTIVCALLLEVGFGLLNLAGPLSKSFELIARAGALGIEDYRPFGEAEQRAAEAKGDVALIGDAKAFYYQVPTSHLFYRTVFDVDVRGRDIVTAWVDGYPQHPADVNIDAGELLRFHRTYYGIPAPPPPATSPSEKP